MLSFTERLNAKQSRVLAITLLVIVLLGLILLVGLPVWSMNRTLDERIAEQRHQIGLYQRMASQTDYYQSAYDRLSRTRQADRRYLQSETESLSEAELQRRVKQIVSAAQGEIVSAQVINISKEEGFSRVSVRIRMKSNLTQSVQIFHRLESEKPYLFIDEVTLRSRPVVRRRIPATDQIRKAESILDIDFQLVGYLKGPAS
ncbi:MAG: type II secretion system protein GspM [Candidatus Thiodiazotropha sp.]